mmetsp:Transcript_198/g.443  ORF Transcript_198/g.443 Transcript_198/m.443 type:complete len:121 (-) Transcript_198:52-414(-)
MDGSHNFSSSRGIFLAIQPLLAEAAVVAVHDTAAWAMPIIDSSPAGRSWLLKLQENDNARWRVYGAGAKRHVLHPSSRQERRFVNWVRGAYPEYMQVHLQTTRYLNKGITLLQRYHRLHV